MQFDIPEVDVPRVVIIGGGFGGIELAKSLKNANVQVVLIDKNNYHTFQPLLYQVATSALEADSIAYPIRKILKKQKNFFFRLAEVEKVLPKEKIIKTSFSDLSYDYLVVATGAQTNFMQNEGLMISSMPMKNVMEALNLRSLILQNFEKALMLSNKRKKQGMMNYVIAGGGPTGVELAGALGELKLHILPGDYPELDLKKMNIYLVQSNKRLLPALSEKSSAASKRYLEQLGVEVRLNTRVVDFHGDYVQTNNGDDIIAKTLIWTAGVRGAPIEGLDNAIVRGSRIQVDEINRVKGHENIYAIGDVAAMIKDELPKGHPMVAPVAIQQAKHLGKNIKLMENKQKPLPFKYKDKGSMATIGKNKAVIEMGKFNSQGIFAWFIWMAVHLLSLVGFRNKFVVFFNWMTNYFTYDKGIRIILTPFDLIKAKRKRKKLVTTPEE